MVDCKILDYTILCVEYKKYKLARFFDKNISSICTDKLIKSLRKYCRKKIQEGYLRKDNIKIPIEAIINEIKPEFGYYLPYLLLKQSKNIRKVAFEKILNKNYKVQDTIVVNISDYIL